MLTHLLRFTLASLILLAITVAAADDAEAPIPYPADTCLVADSKLGSMGDPYVFTHDGYEIKFCCQGCMPAFERDTDTYMEKLKELHAAADQGDEEAAIPYPYNHCLVDGTELDDSARSFVHDGYEIKVCCGTCARDFEADPDTYMEKLKGLHAGEEHEPAESDGHHHHD